MPLLRFFRILPLTAFADEPIENVVSVNSEEVPTAEHYGYTNELVVDGALSAFGADAGHFKIGNHRHGYAVAEF